MKVRKCVRKTCENEVVGSAQVCAECRAKDLLCRNCGGPHGGALGTTKLCPICRSLKRRKRRSPLNPPWTEAEDQAVRDAYATYHSKQIGAKLRELFPTRPRWSIKRRAIQIGASTVRTKDPPWSAEEIAYLTEIVWMSPERIWLKFKERGFKRTITAITIRINRQRVRQHIDGVTAQGLAKLLNIDVHAVLRWIERGWLPKERAGLSSEAGNHHNRHHLTTAAIRKFLYEHPEVIELGKLERVGSKMWFLEMITEGRISENGDAAPQASVDPERTLPLAGQRVSPQALADICGRPVGELLHRIDGLGMSVQEAAFGSLLPPAVTPPLPTLSPRSPLFDEEFAEQVRALVDRSIRRRLGL